MPAVMTMLSRLSSLLDIKGAPPVSFTNMNIYFATCIFGYWFFCLRLDAERHIDRLHVMPADMRPFDATATYGEAVVVLCHGAYSKYAVVPTVSICLCGAR